ncbi:MAG: GNAT family N-acetyltransferase [Bacteroidota bacterium]
MEIQVRKIKKEDNPFIEKIIKSVFEEHGLNKPGTAYYDDCLKIMSVFYSVPGSIYYVGIVNEKIIGGAGVYPTKGLPNGTCELIKMYLLPEARGKGVGKVLVNKCIEFAKTQGYKKMYLETMPEFKNAVRMYERSGFSLLPGSLGNSGHFTCSIHMIKEL